MRIGLMAYSTNTGLGTQTRELAKLLEPAKVLHVDLSGFNGMEQHPDRFLDYQTTYIKGMPTSSDLEAWLDQLDVAFFCETPLNYKAFEIARAKGIKTVLQYNYEFLDYLNQPRLPMPDRLAAPSAWHYEEIQERFGKDRVIALPPPTDASKYKPEQYDKATKFLHIAGRPAIHDRNGTEDLINAWGLLRPSDAWLTIKVQDRGTAKLYEQLSRGLKNVTIDARDIPDQSQLYDGYHVLVMPRRYGGLCLPVNEALAKGMPVIMPEISPNNRLLPNQWLVPAQQKSEFQARTTIPVYQTALTALVEKLRWFIDLGDEQLQYERTLARTIGDRFSHEALRPIYRAELDRLCAE